MKKRIADIVTEFSVEGLNKVQRALKELARDVRESGAKSEKLDKNMQSTAASAEAAAQSVDGIGDAADRASSSTQALGGHLDDAAISAKAASTSIDAVDGSARSASDSIRSSTDSMDDLSDSSRRAASETQDVAQAVERIAPATIDAVQAVDGIGDAATDAGRHIDRVASSVDQVADGLRDARTEAASVADAVSPAALPKADFEEILSYQRRLAQARKAVAGLETSIPDASPDTVDTLRQALDAGQERIRYLEGRLRDGTSERAEAAAAKAQAAADKARTKADQVAARARAAQERARLKAERDAKRAADREERARIAAEKRAARVRPDGIGPNGRPIPVPDVVPDIAAVVAETDRPTSRLRRTLDEVRAVVRSTLADADRLVAKVETGFSKVRSTMQSGGRGAFRGLRSGLSAFQARVGAVSAEVGGLVQDVPGKLRATLLASTAAMVGAIRDPVRAVRNAISGTAHLATATLSRLSVTAQRLGNGSVRSIAGIGPTILRSFRQVGPVTQSVLGAIRTGLTSLGPAASTAFRSIPSLAASAGRGITVGLVGGVLLAGRALAGLGRLAGAGLRSIPRAVGMAARAFSGLARAGASAFRGLSRGASSVARGILSAFADLGSGIVSALTSKFSLVSAALIGLGELTVRAVRGFAPLLGLAGGAAGVVAGIVTMKDVEAVRQLGDALNLPPQVVSQWQFIGASVGAASEDVFGALQTLGTTMTGIAAGDEAMKDVAELFKKLGISVGNANGKFKTASQMMSELALMSRSWDSETRNHVFSAIFGEADALKLSTLFKKVGDDYQNLNAKMAANEANGLLITPEQVATLAEFQKGWGELLFVLKAFARDLFLAFGPLFSAAIEFTKLKLEKPFQRGDIIQKLLVKPFERALALLNDIGKAWLNFNFMEWFTGVSDGGVSAKNLWLYDVKKAATDTYAVFRGLIDIVYGLVEALVGAFRAIDQVVAGITGFSMEGFLLGSGAADFRAFAADVRTILASLFDAPIDPSALTTGLGQSLGKGIEAVKAIVTPIWQAIVQDLIGGWTEFQASLADGRGLAELQTWTATILTIISDLVRDIGNLGKAIWAVFVEDTPPPQGYEWLKVFVGVVEGALRVVTELGQVLYAVGQKLAPLYDGLDRVSQAMAGISGATTILLGVGLARLAGLFAGLAASLVPAGVGAGLGAILLSIATPLGVIAAAIAAVVGGIYLLYNLLTDFTGTVDRIVGALGKAKTFLAGDGEGDVGFVGAAMQRLGLKEDSVDVVRRQSDTWLAQREAARKGLPIPPERTAITEELERLDRQEAAQVAQTAEIEAANVEVKATGRPIILQLPEGDVEMYGSQDAADALMRTRALTVGGTR